MKIVFTYYPLAVRWNHGVAVLTAKCKAAGADACIVPIEDGFYEKIAEIRPEYVGFSFVTKHDYRKCLPYALKLRNAGFSLLAGGVYPRIGGNVNGAIFPLVCRGEAETGLIRFFLEGDNTVFKTPELNQNIDAFPDMEGVTGYEFARGVQYLEGKKIIPYSSSRGCPYSCSFCAAKLLPQKVRFKKTIQQDIAKIQSEHSPDLIYLLDEAPPYYMKEWRDQFVPCNFMAYIRPDINPDDLLFLIDSGLRFCAFGIESGDEKHRIEMLGKNITDKQIFTTIDILKCNGIEFIHYYMTGTLGETYQITEKTVLMSHGIGGQFIVWQHENLGGERRWLQQ